MQRGGFLSDSDRALQPSATATNPHRCSSHGFKAPLVRTTSLEAIQEYGRLVKTVSILRYLHDEQHRRRIHTQLNKGESLHALRRLIFFANQGEIRRRHPDDQDVQGECLTLITNAVIAWNTAYIAHAIDQMQRTGTHIDDCHITRLSPASHNHINFYGRYDFTNPKPPPTGTHRPLRVELDRPISSI